MKHVKKYAVKLVTLESRYYYVDADSEKAAIKEATRLLDDGEPDHNPGLGYLKIEDADAEEMDDA